jgi:putative serine protease PepD
MLARPRAFTQQHNPAGEESVVSINVQERIPFINSTKHFWKLAAFAWALLLFAVAPANVYGQSELEDAQKETTSLAHRIAGGVVSVSTGRGFRAAGGTGFLISDKLIVSSTEVVGKVGSKVRLIFLTGIRGEATVKATDKLSNFALLELKNPRAIRRRLGKRWNPLKLGNSAKLRPGQFIFSMGDPFRSLSSDGIPALSMGSVTRLGRITDGAGSYRGKVIEIDAAVNQGAFGGPVIDLKGRVVGMISSTYSKSRWFGTAVPINTFKSIRSKLITGEKPQSGSLGLAVEDTKGHASVNGVKVVDLLLGGAALEAGLEIGDRIVSIDGQKIYDADDMARELGELPSGTMVKLTILRGKETRDFNLEMRPGLAPIVHKGAPKISLGISLGRNSVKGGGLEITKVKKNSPFLKAGAKAGDVLVRFAGKALSSTDDLRAALKGRKHNEKVVVVISRGGWEKELTIVLKMSGGATPTKLALSVGARVRKNKSGGVVITSLGAKSSAAAGGLKKGDLILFGLKGSKRVAINNAKAFRGFINTHKAGAKAKFIISREGWEKEVSLSVQGTTPATVKPRTKAAGAWLGLKVKKTATGAVVIASVDQGSPAAKAGLKKGDVLKSVAGKNIGSARALSRVLAGKKPGQTVKLKVSRDGWGRGLKLKLGKK